MASLSDVVWPAAPSPRRLLCANRAFEVVWGIAVTDVYRKPDLWMDAIHPDERVRVENDWENALRGEPFDAEYCIIRSGGAVRWIHEHAVSICDDAGSVLRLDGIARDITDAKQQHNPRLNRIQAVSISPKSRPGGWR